MKLLKYKILIFMSVICFAVMAIPKQVRAEDFIKTNVPFTSGLATDNYDFSKYEKVSVDATYNHHIQHVYSDYYHTSAAVVLSAYKSDGTLIQTKTATSSSGYGTVNTTLTIDLSSEIGLGYFVISYVNNGVWHNNVESGAATLTANASNLSLYQYPSPSIDTNLP